MARRVTPAQLRSQIRQAEQKQRQAISRYNSAVRKHNSDVKRRIDNYNREVRAHNARVRSNRQRLEREIRRLNSTPRTTTHVVYRRSVVTLHESFQRLESASAAGTWDGGDDLLDLSEGEAANSVAVLNALDAEPGQADPGNPALQETSLEGELAGISLDLDARWRGALYSLNPQNPDAARHFCTSSREILTGILEVAAPDSAVLEANPMADRTDDGRVTRRARVRFCLDKRGGYDAELAAFIDDDLENVITLFREFNDATHGSAGRFDLPQLSAIKRRVEDAVRFLHRVVC